MTAELMQELVAIARASGEKSFSADSVGGMFGIYFSDRPPVTFEDVNRSDRERFNRFFHEMLTRGVYLAPSAFEAGFLSIAHEGDPIRETLDAAKESFKALQR